MHPLAVRSLRPEVVIYLQADKPKDANRKKNWLPAPKDGFQFGARLHGLHAPLLDGSYNMPGVVRGE
jgi:hypothetical protein